MRDRLIIVASMAAMYMYIDGVVDSDRAVEVAPEDDAELIKFIPGAVDVYIQNNPGELDMNNYNEYIYYSLLLHFGRRDLVKDLFGEGEGEEN